MLELFRHVRSERSDPGARTNHDQGRQVFGGIRKPECARLDPDLDWGRFTKGLEPVGAEAQPGRDEFGLVLDHGNKQLDLAWNRKRILYLNIYERAHFIIHAPYGSF